MCLPGGMSNSPVDYDPPATEPSGPRTEFVGNGTDFQSRCRLLVEPAPKLPKVASVPYLVVTGEASIHILWDDCAAMFIRQIGGTAHHVKLGDVGLRGNWALCADGDQQSGGGGSSVRVD